MKRVLIFATTYLPFIGGAEIAISEITKRISNFEFDLITVNLDGKQKKFERIGNVNVYRVTKYKILFPIIAPIKAVFLKNKPDLIWSVMASYAGFAGMFCSYIRRVPFVLTLQEGDTKEELKQKFQFVYPLFKKIFRRAHIIQAISKYLAEFAKDMNRDADVVVIPNGVDVRKFSGGGYILDKKDNDIYLITTSRLVTKNAVVDIIVSLKYLPKNIKLIIVGDGEQREELEKSPYKDRVIFMGEVEHEKIPGYLRSADIFIRPSLSEGFGNSFVEAMAAKIPVIATNVGGISDFIVDGETGLFCEVKNPEDIAKRVMYLIEDIEKRKNIVENAYQMVKDEYEWDIISDKMKKSVFDVVLR